MKIHKALHPLDDVDRLYVSKREWMRGLASIENSVDALIQQLEDHTEMRGGRMISATRNNIEIMRSRSTEITRKQKWEEKQFYRRFKQLTSEISREKTWSKLIKGNLKRKTDSLLIAARNNAIKTNQIKVRIDKTQQNSECRLCGDRDETINHIISECSKLAKNEYKTKHDWVGKVIHWELCKNWSLTIRTNGIYTTQNLSRRMRHTNSSEILRYKRITKSRPNDQTK